ncbi:cysteine-rich KTR domain-containing protein [uncultured Enterococcus sp.]|uniref:cysteine-rich KTR domain-containing protein n=1 Tax=uncultured Enterococcus sp. TaxID=167972 RepID=UPI002AA60354|nr:cysteine-rich KTR domain-containing protein [uncultured Enterococcus sp.]
MVQKHEWVLCPVCNNKTRMQIRGDTEIKKLPLYCPKCKKESLIDIKDYKISITKEPDAMTQSQ